MTVFVIHGYASVFSRTFIGNDEGSMVRIKPGAYRVASGRWQLWHQHERPTGRPLASIRGDTLRVFDDGYGLGFEATISGEHADWLRTEVASGRLTGVSTGEKLNSTWYTAADGVSECVQAELEEISLVYAPRQEIACCWLADCFEPALNDIQRRARARFNLHRQSERLAARSAKIIPFRGRSNALQIPDSVTELLRGFEAGAFDPPPPNTIPPDARAVYEQVMSSRRDRTSAAASSSPSWAQRGGIIRCAATQ